MEINLKANPRASAFKYSSTSTYPMATVKKPISHLIKRIASNVTSNIMRAILPDEICYGYRVSNNRFLDGIEDHVFNGDVCRQVVKLRGLAVPGMRLKLSEITQVKENRNISERGQRHLVVSSRFKWSSTHGIHRWR